MRMRAYHTSKPQRPKTAHYFLPASVLLAAGDDRVVEHVQERAAQRLGAVDDAQDRPGDIQAALAQPHQ
jgi:hypothetical protein